MPSRSFKQFVEQEFGKFPQFLIYAILEWALILILFMDGILAFLANEFARFFELRIPCLLCTRIDHVLVRRNPDFYYNDSICKTHKKQVSHMAYCHVHKKLSDIRMMCEGCLLSFATGREADCDTYKSLVGILHKDLECFVEDDLKINLKLEDGRKEEDIYTENNGHYRCSCCGDLLKVKLDYSKGHMNGSVMTKSIHSAAAPAPSPRAPFARFRSFSSSRNLELHRIHYTELKLVADHESEGIDDVDVPSAMLAENRGKDLKAATVPLLNESGYLSEEPRTPSSARANRFFGIPLTDSAAGTPRWSSRAYRKSPLEKTEFSSEAAEGNQANEADGDSILHRLKRQVRLDRKSLMALYMELDEERSASAVAANNAMAMITRLQAEKAAVQMEALQYQRLMEEQAEYDQEAIQVMKDLLTKKDDEMRDLEDELEIYRERYGLIIDDSCVQELHNQADNGSQELTPHSLTGEKFGGANLPAIVTASNSNGAGDEENFVTPRTPRTPCSPRISANYGIEGRSPLPLLAQVQKSLSRKRMLGASNVGMSSTEQSSNPVDQKSADKSIESEVAQEMPHKNDSLMKVLEGSSRFFKEAAAAQAQDESRKEG